MDAILVASFCDFYNCCQRNFILSKKLKKVFVSKVSFSAFSNSVHNRKLTEEIKRIVNDYFLINPVFTGYRLSINNTFINHLSNQSSTNLIKEKIAIIFIIYAISATIKKTERTITKNITG